MTDHLVYRVDAVAAITMGSALLFVATPLTALSGWSLPPAFLFGAGVFLLPWAAFNAWISIQPSVPRWAALVNLLVDGSWVMGSVALLLLHGASMSPVGIVLLLGQALSVLSIFGLKLGPVVRLRFARR